MTSNVRTIRVYDQKKKETLDVSIDMQFFFIEEDGEKRLLNQKVDPEYKLLLTNSDDSWDYGEKGLGVKGEIEIGNISNIFGAEQLVSEDAEVGIAFEWLSKSSSQRGIFPLEAKLNNGIDKNQIQFEYYFENRKLFGEVGLSLVLYLKNSGYLFQPGQARLPGSILGILEEWNIILDGSGSTFPIVFVDEPSSPLWYVDFNYTEPLIEPFDKEYIAIYLNKSHDSFESIKTPKTKIDKSLYVEFLASSLQLILQNLMNCPDWNDIQSGTNCEEGSIGEVIYYFKTTFKWDFDTPEKLAISLRRDLDARVKKGEI